MVISILSFRSFRHRGEISDVLSELAAIDSYYISITSNINILVATVEVCMEVVTVLEPASPYDF